MWTTIILSIGLCVCLASAQLPNYFQGGSPPRALVPQSAPSGWQSSGPTRSWFSGPNIQSSPSPAFSQYQPYRPSAPAVPTVSSIPSPTLGGLSGAYNRFQAPLAAPQPPTPSWSQWSGNVNRFSSLSQPITSYSSFPRPAAPQLASYARPAPAPVAPAAPLSNPSYSANPSFLPQPQNPWGTPNNVQFTVNHQSSPQAAAPASVAPAQSWSPPAPAPQVYSPPARPAQTWSAPPPTTSTWSAPAAAPAQQWSSQPSAPSWTPAAQSAPVSAPQPAPQSVSTYQSPQNAQNLRPAPVHYASIGPQLQGDYKFGYHTGDGGSFREETRLPDGTVQGAYGFVDADGKQRIVRYTAGKNGFQADGDGVPKAVASPSDSGSSDSPQAPAPATINIDEGAAFKSFQQG